MEKKVSLESLMSMLTWRERTIILGNQEKRLISFLGEYLRPPGKKGEVMSGGVCRGTGGGNRGGESVIFSRRRGDRS